MKTALLSNRPPRRLRLNHLRKIKMANRPRKSKKERMARLKRQKRRYKASVRMFQLILQLSTIYYKDTLKINKENNNNALHTKQLTLFQRSVHSIING
jgi:hypothetical protein